MSFPTTDQEWLERWYGEISGFKDPAYTYILKWPVLEWKHWERETLDIFSPGTASIVEAMVDEEQSRVLEDAAYDWHQSLAMAIKGESTLGYHLCVAAYEACRKLMSMKQQQHNPDFSCLVQAEIGEENLHVHIVLGGSGLTKFNAKKNQVYIAREWFKHLYAKFRLFEESNFTKNVQYHIAGYISRALDQLKRHDVSGLCEILTYRDRHGEEHAQRIDPRSFIQNYILPKNRKCFSYMSYQMCTIELASFDTNKTYIYTQLNDYPITHYLRKELYKKLINNDSAETGEPPFKMARWEELPKVTDNQLEQKTIINKPQRVGRKTNLMLDTLQRCEENFICTLEEMVLSHPEIVLMYEGMPGGNKALENILEMYKIKVTRSHTALSFLESMHIGSDSINTDNKAVRLFNYQGYNAMQAGHWICTVLDKKAGKQNTICFFGPASTGKTNIAKAVAEAVKLYGCVNHLNKNFVFNDCQNKLLAWWEECVMSNDWVEPAKCLMGGTKFRVDRKHKDSAEQPQTPLLISTNHNIYTVVGGNAVTSVHEKPIRDRVCQFDFMKALPQDFGEITVNEIAEWLLCCRAEFECTLNGFRRRWKLDKIPNRFPLGELCSGHTQDWTLYSHGPCYACGGYLPHTNSPDGDWNRQEESDQGKESSPHLLGGNTKGSRVSSLCFSYRRQPASSSVRRPRDRCSSFVFHTRELSGRKRSTFYVLVNFSRYAR
ncbi:NS1 [Vicugna pacos bocaparvovirus]|uniref:Initiator protein NS1 n=1 Tax=Vicugna pacos bocaparvovirus TaxID=2597326 RepID=A0A5J6BDH4_9VIRU|nr:NS1 [Vicugna pacos bocaparvovirus]QDQ17565.1 NS1 [Vicugna pacos bocaparvovirus]